MESKAKNMSAFAFYQNAAAQVSPPEKKRASQGSTKKKRKLRENGVVAASPVNKKKPKKILKSGAKGEHLKTLPEAKPCEDDKEGTALPALLADLTKVNNSRDRASQLFQWFIHPIPAKNPDYYKGLFSTAEFDRILREGDVQYGVNLDVTSYANGKRETHNPPGRALPFTAWDFYSSGCSLRMLNPQAFSSTSEIGKPVVEVVLEAGDLLYFPRGFIHQGHCLPDTHSLHITVSSYQKNSWGDLLAKLVPAAVGVAMEEDVEYRQGLPLDYLTYMGEDPRRDKFVSRVGVLMQKLASYAPVDAAVDEKAKDVKGASTRWGNGRPLNVGAHIHTQTRVRLIRAGCARLCSDGEAIQLFYTTDNSRVYHKEELKSFEIKSEYADGIEFLIHSYPKFAAVQSVPCDSTEEKIALAEMLFEKGIIHTAEPL
ncbi:hypothetical protein CRUP_022847 [Coryphaenoides rupestris]|nr:hypothetical protein CRUP_022847 [Coryphaenoides rupestris]